jgi:hypothetical protein
MCVVNFAPAARLAAAEGVWHRLESRAFRTFQRSCRSRFEAVPDAASHTVGVRHLGFHPAATLSNPLKEMT